MTLWSLKQTIDPVFGELSFHRTLVIVGTGFWRGKLFFPSTETEVTVQVVAGQKGPSENQRSFYKELIDRYPVLLDSIKSVIMQTPARYWGDDFFGNLVPELSWDDFALDSIGFSARKNDVWYLSYMHLPFGATYSVAMDGWSPVEGTPDD